MAEAPATRPLPTPQQLRWVLVVYGTAVFVPACILLTLLTSGGRQMGKVFLHYLALPDPFPVAIAYGPDPVSAAKVVTQYAKDHEHFTVVGALMGADVLDVKAVSALATLPSLDQLRAKLLGLINAPATRVAGVLQAPAAQIARVIGAQINRCVPSLHDARSKSTVRYVREFETTAGVRVDRRDRSFG